MSNNRLIVPRDDYTDAELDGLRTLDYNPTNVDLHLKHYGEFLHEGDFEIRMAAAHSKQNSIERMALDCLITESEIRTLWLRKGRARFASHEWNRLHIEYTQAHMRFRLYKAVLEKNTAGRYNMQPPKVL